MNPNNAYQQTDIRLQIMFAVISVCIFILGGIIYFLTEQRDLDLDAVETLPVNYSSILSRINYSKPDESTAVKLAATKALQDGKITNGEYKSFMNEYTLKSNGIATQDYDQARHEADKKSLINLLKHGG